MSWENAYRPYDPRPQESGKALAALILGICGLVVCPLVCSILAIVFATQARAEIGESRGRLGGANYAQVGLILGWIGTAIGLVELSVFLIFFFGAFESSGGF
jgi:multisubunit Na+/H+ antiporter MnhB subunit